MNNNRRFNQYRKLISLMDKRHNQEVVPFSVYLILLRAERKLMPWGGRMYDIS